MADDAIEKVNSAEAWTEFCDLLKKAGEVILREDLETTEFDRAEGLRYLSRLLRAGLHSFAENPGPKNPRFRTNIQSLMHSAGGAALSQSQQDKLMLPSNMPQGQMDGLSPGDERRARVFGKALSEGKKEEEEQPTVRDPLDWMDYE